MYVCVCMCVFADGFGVFCLLGAVPFRWFSRVLVPSGGVAWCRIGGACSRRGLVVVGIVCACVCVCARVRIVIPCCVELYNVDCVHTVGRAYKREHGCVSWTLCTIRLATLCGDETR